MRAMDGYQTYILGSAAAYTLASQSASGPTTYDGTAWVSEAFDDYILGPQQALFYSTAQAYSETAETYDASDWLSALARYICRIVFAEKPFVNLVILRASASTVDIDATSIYVGWKKHESVNLTLDITASGALGLDTGTESADAWYYIWLLSKLDGTLTGVLSASATSPTLPTGYIFSKLVGSVRNTSGDFDIFVQTDNYVEINTKQILSGGGSATYAAIDCTTFYPVTAKKIIGWLDIGTTGSNVYVYLSNTGTLDTYVYRIQTVPEYHSFYINIKNTTIYYKTTNDIVSIYLTGYILDI